MSFEQVRDLDFMQGGWRAWKAEKNRGVDGDALPLPVLMIETGMRPSFAQAWNAAAHELQWNSSFAQPIGSPVFCDASAFSELCGSIAASDLEPLQYLDKVMFDSGLTIKSELAVELTQLFHTLFSLAITDLLDLKHSSTAELLSRRVLEILSAVNRDPQAPDFGEAYARHVAARHGTGFVPKFKSPLAKMMRDEVLYLKQMRLAREEEEAKTKKPTMGKGDGPGGGGGGGDSKGCGGGGGENKQDVAASSGE